MRVLKPSQEAVCDANQCCCSHLLGEAEAEALANVLEHGPVCNRPAVSPVGFPLWL